MFDRVKFRFIMKHSAYLNEYRPMIFNEIRKYIYLLILGDAMVYVTKENIGAYLVAFVFHLISD